MSSAANLLPERVAQRILILRGIKVMLDTDLAELYGVPTKALNQAVRRNAERFPEDFMFRLTKEEKQWVVTNCDHLAKLAELERKVSTHDQAITGLINAIRQLMKTPETSSRPIGFTANISNKKSL